MSTLFSFTKKHSQLLIILMLVSMHTIAQQSPYYKAAAETFRDAASRTNCPEKKQVLLQWASYNDCIVNKLADSKVNCIEPSKHWNMPCNADLANTNGANNTNNTGTPSMSKITQDKSIENQNSISAGVNTYNNALNRGKKESGALLEATLATAGQLSDPVTAKSVLSVGGALTLLKFLSEKKAEKLEAQKESKKALTELVKQRVDVFDLLETADYSHSKADVSFLRNKKGRIKSLSVNKSADIYFDYADVINSQDSVYILTVEKEISENAIIILKEVKFAFADITGVTKEPNVTIIDISSRDRLSNVSYMNQFDIVRLSNAVAEDESNIDIPSGLTTVQIRVNAMAERQISCAPEDLQKSFILLSQLIFKQRSSSIINWNFHNTEIANNTYHLLIPFTY